MTIRDLEPQNRSYLTISDLENIFKVYPDKKQNFVYNLNSSLFFDIDENSLEVYKLKHNMHWPLISYKLYGTTRLAWLLMKLNNVTTKDVFNMKQAGDEIFYLPTRRVTSIVESINYEDDE